MNCQIVFTNRQREISFSLTELSLQNVVHTVLLCEDQTADFLSIEFLSDKETRRLHKKFFKDPSSTDCMSFPIDLVTQLGPRHLGDIVICPMTALKQSQNTPNLFFEEMTLYLIHGVLHLLGYDDATPQERKIMRQREHRVMKRLRQQGQMLSGKLKL